MSEKVEKDAFERLVDRVLSYKPKKAEKKRQKRLLESNHRSGRCYPARYESAHWRPPPC
jgi:hypothetical protein